MQLPGRNQSDGTAGSPGNPTGRIRIEAENYNDSLSNGITKEACGDIGGTLDVGYIDAGDSITYDVAAPVSGLYTINFRLANGGNTSSFQVRSGNGTVLATITVPYTGGWQNYITLPATAMLPAGQQRLQLLCTSNNWNINWLELLPPATGSGGFNGSGAYHIEAEDFISQNGTLLENCQDAGGTYNIGSINSGDWLDYRVTMPVGGSYQLSVRAASANSGANTVQLLTATGTVLATLNVSNTGSYQTFATYTANVSLPAGVQTLRLAVTGGYMAVNWLELAAPNSTVPLDNYALVLNNNFNYTGGMVYEAENTFTVEFMVKPKVAHQIDVESTSGTGGTDGQKYVMFPVHGGSEADSRAGMGISVGTNGVSVYEHADGYMPALLVWEYPIDTVWTHVAVVYHNGKPSLYINGVWKKDGLQSLRQHVYPGTMFPGGYYGSQGDGILDEVRIWSVARTPAQIAANKDGELTGPQTGLVGYWPMNEGTGLVLHDVSGSGRDVDLTSAGYTSASWTNGRYSVASITGSYRYGFNGQEHSTEINEDNDYTAEFWEYDSRIGRRWNVDPVVKTFLSSYEVLGNNPIMYVDPFGDDKKRAETKNDYGGYSAWEIDETGNATGLGMSGAQQNVYVKGKNKSRPWNNAFFGFDKTTRHEANAMASRRQIYNSLIDHGNTREDITKMNLPGLDKSEFDNFDRHIKAEKDSRVTQAWVAGIILAPFAYMLAPEAFSAAIETRFISAGGDATAQYLTNISRYGFGKENVYNWNITSIAGSFVAPNSEFASALIGSGFSATIAGGYNGFDVNKDNTNVIGNIALYYFANKLGNRYNSTLKNPKTPLNIFRSNLLGNTSGNAAQGIKDIYIYN